MRYLVLGSGPAGIAAARAARKADKDADVVVATEEYAAPYLRPNLADLVAAGIEVKSGKRARRVDASKNRILFSDGSEETYNFLCIATGGRPIVPLALMGAMGSFLFLNS